MVGATGATGRLLVQALVDRQQTVKTIVRSKERLPDDLTAHPDVTVREASLLDLSDDELRKEVDGCDAIASCLGHTMSLGGIYGKPRRLVTDATKRLCGAVQASPPARPTRFVLMNTAGNSNRDLDEPLSFGQKCIIGLLRLLLPPHVDNEEAADYLRVSAGQSDAAIEWVVVRPDTLIDEDEASEYELHPSPTRSAIFDPGKTSRVNVAHFMAELVTNEATWREWKGRMPVIYNA